MSILDVFKRSAQVPQPVSGTALSLSRLLGQQAYDTDPIRTDGDALRSYQGWVYACVSMISQDVRSSSWNVWEKVGQSRSEWKPLDEAQIPDVLLRPNPSQTWGDLIELTQVHMDLCGRAFWHLITNGPGGQVVGLQIINPDWVEKPEYHEDRATLKGWRITVNGSGRRLLPAEDVIQFRYPDPVDPHRGMSPIRAVAMSADMDTYSRAYAASHLRNHAQPTGILTTTSELTRDQANALAEQWQDSHQGSNRIQVLGKGAEFQTLSAHLKDLEFLSLARVSRDQLLSAFNVPASRLGLVEDSSKANGEESDRVYSSLCLSPRLRRYHEPITLRLLPRLGLDSSRFCFEFDPVELHDKEFERVSAEAAFKSGAITLDEYRDRIGFEPESNGKGSVYFVPLGAQIVDQPDSVVAIVDSGEPGDSEPVNVETNSAAKGEAAIGESVEPDLVLNGAQVASLVSIVEAMMSGTLPYSSALEIVQSAFGMSEEKARRILGPESNAGINEPAAVAEAVDRAVRSLDSEDAELPEPTSERMEIAALRFLSGQEKAERRLKGRVRALLSRMQKALVSEAKAGRLRSAPAVDRRALLEDILDAFNDDLALILMQEALKAVGEGHENFATEVASTVSPEKLISFNLISDDVLEWARSQSAEKVTGILDDGKQVIRDIFTESLAEGDPIDTIADKLNARFDTWKGVKAETVARTESSNAYNYGKHNHAELLNEANDDLRVLKTWLPTADEYTRDAHKPGAIKTRSGRAKRTVFSEEPFVVDGEELMHPGDPASEKPGNVINCRCTLTHAVIEASDADKVKT